MTTRSTAARLARYSLNSVGEIASVIELQWSVAVQRRFGKLAARCTLIHNPTEAGPGCGVGVSTRRATHARSRGHCKHSILALVRC